MRQRQRESGISFFASFKAGGYGGWRRKWQDADSLSSPSANSFATFPNRLVCFSDSFRTFGGMEVRIYAPYGIINISENFSKDEIQKRDNKSFRTKQFDARREKIQVLFF